MTRIDETTGSSWSLTHIRDIGGVIQTNQLLESRTGTRTINPKRLELLVSNWDKYKGLINHRKETETVHLAKHH